MDAWYALHTKPQSEIQVHCALTVRGFETYLPMLPALKDGRARPFFPAYMFVHCDLEAVGIGTLRWIPGLRRILSFAGRPAVVPDDAIELVRAKMQEIDAQGGLPRHSFQVGDRVVLDKGPLSGMSGIFQGPTGPVERVQILIRFLGQANRAEVPVDDLRPASDQDADAMRRQRGTRGAGRHIHYASDGLAGSANT
jgi:transcriptional antiterminator RfaH